MSNKPQNSISDEQKAEVIEAKKLYIQLNESLAIKTTEFEEAKRNLEAKNKSLNALITRCNDFNKAYQTHLNLGNYTQSQLDEEKSKFIVLKSELEKLQNTTESAEKEYQEKKDVMSQAEFDLGNKLEVLNKLLGQNFVQAKDNDERNKLANNLNSLLDAKKLAAEALNVENEKNKKLNAFKDKTDKASKDFEEKIKNFDKAKSESKDIGVDLNKLNQALKQGKNSLDNLKKEIEAEANNAIWLLHAEEKPKGEKFKAIAGHYEHPLYPPVDLSAEKGPCWWKASPNENIWHNEGCLNKVKNLKTKLKNKLDAIEKIATAKTELEISALQNSIDSLKELISKEQDLLSANVNAQTTKDLENTKQAELLKAQENLAQKQTELNSLLKQSEQIKLDFKAIKQSQAQANKEFQDTLELIENLNEKLEDIKLEHQDAKETFEGLSSLYQYDGTEECSSPAKQIVGDTIKIEL